ARRCWRRLCCSDTVWMEARTDYPIERHDTVHIWSKQSCHIKCAERREYIAWTRHEEKIDYRARSEALHLCTPIAELPRPCSASYHLFPGRPPRPLPKSQFSKPWARIALRFR